MASSHLENYAIQDGEEEEEEEEEEERRRQQQQQQQQAITQAEEEEEQEEEDEEEDEETAVYPVVNQANNANLCCIEGCTNEAPIRNYSSLKG